LSESRAGSRIASTDFKRVSGKWNAGFLASDDLVEAMTAFMEKRPGQFTGR